MSAVERLVTWFADFRDSKNFWLEFSDEHADQLEEAYQRGENTTTLEHKWTNRSGKRRPLGTSWT